MNVFSNIHELNLSQNLLRRFDGQTIVDCCKHLQRINFDYNQLESLEDFIPLGKLTKLTHLSLLQNPITMRKEGLPLLEELMFPSSLKKLSLVEILTATYTNVPLMKETIQNNVIDKSNFIYDEDIARMASYSRGKVEVPKDDWNEKPITLFKRTRWIFSVMGKPCPARKVGLFQALEFLNGELVTVFDVFMITGKKKLDEVARDGHPFHVFVITELFITKSLPNSQKHTEYGHAEAANQRVRLKHQRAEDSDKSEDDARTQLAKNQTKQTTKYYLRKYQRKLDIFAAQFEPIHYLPPEAEDSTSL